MEAQVQVQVDRGVVEWVGVKRCGVLVTQAVTQARHKLDTSTAQHGTHRHDTRMAHARHMWGVHRRGVAGTEGGEHTRERAYSSPTPSHTP